MVSNKQMDRALHGPGVFEIVFGVALSVVLGVLLASLHLIFKPVEVVTKPVDAPVAGQVYFEEGASNSSKARQWTRKRQMLADGASAEVTFNEEELNAWMASVAPQPAAPQKDAANAPLFNPERVNFRIRDGVFQVALVGKVAVLEMTHELVFQTRGNFVRGDDGYEYAPKEFYIGSLPTHTVPGLASFLIKRVLAAQELPEDLTKTWKSLKLVEVNGSTVRVVLP